MFLKAFSSKIEKYAQETPDSGYSKANFMVNMFDKKSEEEKKAIFESSQNFLEKISRYEGEY